MAWKQIIFIVLVCRLSANNTYTHFIDKRQVAYRLLSSEILWLLALFYTIAFLVADNKYRMENSSTKSVIQFSKYPRVMMDSWLITTVCVHRPCGSIVTSLFIFIRLIFIATPNENKTNNIECRMTRHQALQQRVFLPSANMRSSLS